jgi:hypothetical protein
VVYRFHLLTRPAISPQSCKALHYTNPAKTLAEPCQNPAKILPKSCQNPAIFLQESDMRTHQIPFTLTKIPQKAGENSAPASRMCATRSPQGKPTQNQHKKTLQNEQKMNTK